MAKQKWTLKITLEVDDTWVTDGYDASERLGEYESLIRSTLGYAYDHEVRVKATVLTAPKAAVIRKLQDAY